MRQILMAAAALSLLAACSGAENDEAVGTDAAEASDTASSDSGDDATTDYNVPEPIEGLAWYYKEASDGGSAVYGPPEAGGYVMVTCTGSEIAFDLPDVDALEGRETATLVSGPLSDEFESGFDDEGMSILFFSAPAGNAVVQRIGKDGFTINFPNGEENPFPPDEALTKVVEGCAK